MLLLMSCVQILNGEASTEGAKPADARSSDEQIQSKLELALRLDGRINWQLLAIRVQEGKVDLMGEVRTPEEKGLATEIASTVDGVKTITNRIIVTPDLPPETPRAHIEERTREHVLEGPGALKDRQLQP
jgi:osmotically-inducible protein OsmY